MKAGRGRSLLNSSWIGQAGSMEARLSGDSRLQMMYSTSLKVREGEDSRRRRDHGHLQKQRDYYLSHTLNPGGKKGRLFSFESSQRLNWGY
jgi:hypothetical protein